MRAKAEDGTHTLMKGDEVSEMEENQSDSLLFAHGGHQENNTG